MLSGQKVLGDSESRRLRSSLDVPDRGFNGAVRNLETVRVADTLDKSLVNRELYSTRPRKFDDSPSCVVCS